MIRNMCCGGMVSTTFTAILLGSSWELIVILAMISMVASAAAFKAAQTAIRKDKEYNQMQSQLTRIFLYTMIPDVVASEGLTLIRQICEEE